MLREHEKLSPWMLGPVPSLRAIGGVHGQCLRSSGMFAELSALELTRVLTDWKKVLRLYFHFPVSRKFLNYEKVMETLSLWNIQKIPSDEVLYNAYSVPFFLTKEKGGFSYEIYIIWS